MPIAKIPADIRHYLADFDVTAIAITGKGRIVVVDNPAGHEAAWWVARKDANRLREECRKKKDVEQAAKRLKLKITPHTTCMARAEQSLGRLDAILHNAKADGTLQKFNQTYRQRRTAAAAFGQPFMPYSAAYSRLQRALSKCIAAGVSGNAFELALTSVFDQPPSLR